MQRDTYDAMARVQDRHWWFTGRRAVLTSVIRSLALPAGTKILEVGAGTGANLSMLREFGDVVGCEFDPPSQEYCVANGWDVRPGALPDGLAAVQGTYGLICLFDVLEHVERDADSLGALTRLLDPNGGVLLIACPANPWLYGEYDRLLGHFRRYTHKELRALVEAAGLNVVRSGFYNTILFPLVIAGRLVEKLRPPKRVDALSLPPWPVNTLLYWPMAVEGKIAGTALFPFGTSVLVAARRGAQPKAG